MWARGKGPVQREAATGDAERAATDSVQFPRTASECVSRAMQRDSSTGRPRLLSFRNPGHEGFASLNLGSHTNTQLSISMRTQRGQLHMYSTGRTAIAFSVFQFITTGCGLHLEGTSLLGNGGLASLSVRGGGGDSRGYWRGNVSCMVLLAGDGTHAAAVSLDVTSAKATAITPSDAQVPSFEGASRPALRLEGVSNGAGSSASNEFIVNQVATAHSDGSVGSREETAQGFVVSNILDLNHDDHRCASW
jgi:hypothetical protein